METANLTNELEFEISKILDTIDSMKAGPAKRGFTLALGCVNPNRVLSMWRKLLSCLIQTADIPVTTISL